MTRLFLAINLPELVKKQLFELGKQFKPLGNIKIVEEKNIHITLKFLGEAGSEEVIPLLDGIEFDSFELFLNGLGVFPNTSYVRVIWAGCKQGSEKIVTLHNLIEERLTEFSKDKEFHPHATLARVKFLRDKQRLIDLIEANKETEFGKFKANSFVLMESTLTPSGPEYKIVKSFQLS